MQFERRFAELIRNGEVTSTFRRWRRPQVVAGRRYRVAWIGFIDVQRIDEVQRASVKPADATRRIRVGPRTVQYIDDKSVAAARRCIASICLRRRDAGPRAQLARRIASTDESDAARNSTRWMRVVARPVGAASSARSQRRQHARRRSLWPSAVRHVQSTRAN